jgi:hypothetical protein
MAIGFSKEVAAQKAQDWANEQNEPFTVYKDQSGAYLATELSHFQNNPDAHRGCVQQGNYYPQTTAEATAPATIKIKYFVIGYSENLGNTYDGKPKVVTAAELDEERRQAGEGTDGNWNVLVIHEFEIEQNN